MGYIHRDLKPANVVIGNDSTEAHFIYLIDFGLAKKENSSNPVPADTKSKVPKGGVQSGPNDPLDKESVIDPKTGKKKTAAQTLKEYIDEEKDNFRVVGTAMYAGLAAHLPNKKYLKKDDIESLLFLMSYFGVGQLPWRYKTNQEGLEKMMHYKFEIKPKELFPSSIFPPHFPRLFEYIRALPDDQDPDYNYMVKELHMAAQHAKVNPSLLITLDWMNCPPLVDLAPSSHQTQSASVSRKQGSIESNTSKHKLFQTPSGYTSS
jgi:serine/threonine protein kinase